MMKQYRYVKLQNLLYMKRIIPVSYTHLDVYKRQAYKKVKDLTEKISEINYKQLELKKKKGNV